MLLTIGKMQYRREKLNARIYCFESFNSNFAGWMLMTVETVLRKCAETNLAFVVAVMKMCVTQFLNMIVGISSYVC
jgi:hypothetical protein